MKNLLKDIETGLMALAFTGIVIAAPAGIHIKKIAENYYIKNFSERYYDGRVPKISKEIADERINLGNDIIYSSLVFSGASLAGGILLNQRRKIGEKGK